MAESPFNIEGVQRAMEGLSARIVPTFRMPDLSGLTSHREENCASAFRERLIEWVNEFDATLDQSHEVGVRLVSFGQTVVFHLTGIGYSDPSLIAFAGTTESGEPVELIQHVSQISILLMKLPRSDPSTPKQPIGFHGEQESASSTPSSSTEPNNEVPQ